MNRNTFFATAALLMAMPAWAGKATGPTTLEQANSYTDTKVATEATARGAADSQEATIRESADASLQAQINASAGQTPLSVYDGDGKLIGRLIGDGIAVVSTTNGLVAVDLADYNPVYFPTSDCSGTRYIATSINGVRRKSVGLFGFANVTQYYHLDERTIRILAGGAQTGQFTARSMLGGNACTSLISDGPQVIGVVQAFTQNIDAPTPWTVH